MYRLLSILFIAIGAISASAQQYESAFHISQNTTVPLSDKDFISKTSSSGIRVGFSKFLGERFGFGIEGGYSILKDYVPLQTYESPGSSITTDIYNYMYYFTIMASGQYYFVQGERFIPYASLGMGFAATEYKIFYNVYSEADKPKAFVIRPEIGTLFRLKEYSSWGLKAALSFDYATNKSEYFDTDNFAALNFQIGVVLLSH